MKTIDFPTFVDAVKSAYASNKNTYKKKIHGQISEISANENFFQEFFEKVKENASSSADLVGSHIEWDGRDGSLFNDLKSGKGSAKKAAAIHFYFLTFKEYQKYAEVMNAAIKLGDRLGYDPQECIWDDHLADCSGNNSDEVESAHQGRKIDDYNRTQTSPRPAWKFRAHKLESVDFVRCTVGLSVTQNQSADNPISFLAHLSIDRLYADEYVEFGVCRLYFTTDIVPDKECEVRFFEHWKDARFVGHDSFAKLEGSGGEGRLRIQFAEGDGILVGEFDLKDCELFELQPFEDEFEFQTELLVQRKDTSLRAADGKLLEDKNKEIVIKSLLAKELGEEKQGGWLILARKKFRLEQTKEDT